MIFDLFYSKLTRDDLAEVYSDYYKTLYGDRPVIDPETNRAGLVDLIEELSTVDGGNFD
jgi:hypothetical protein